MIFHWPSFLCGIVVLFTFEVILAIIILKWLSRKKKQPDEDSKINEIVERYNVNTQSK